MIQRQKYNRTVTSRRKPERFFAVCSFIEIGHSSLLKFALVTVFLLISGNVARAQVRLEFDNAPTLVSGTALTQGAVYRFPDVAPGTDALVTLTTISAGTTLIGTLDDNASNADRFQPVIRTTAANTVGYVRFDFQLVKTGTSVPRAVPSVKISAQDIDGTSSSNREFIEFVGMQSTSVASPTTLISRTPIAAGGVAYAQQSPGTNQAGIGTGNNYEFYGTLSDTATDFTIIAGNIVGTANCTLNDNTCNRLNSYAFDPASSNVTVPAPDVSITKTGPASVAQNGTVTYTLTARNLGTTTAHGATVTDNVPATLTNVTITCAASGGAVCPSTAGLTTLSNEFIATFPNGGQVVFTISGTASTVGTLTNTATIAAPNGSTDPTPANNTSATITTIVTAAADLTITKTHTGDFTTGAAGTYTVTVTNSGTASSSGTITVTDTLPAGLTVNGGAAGAVAITGANAANWACNSNAASPQVITCTSLTVIVIVAGSNKSVFSFAVNVGLAAAVGTNSVTNNASVSGGGDSNTANNTASDPTTILSPDLTITKTHAGNFTRGATGIYTITVTNGGTVSTSGAISVTDSLPTGLSVNGGAAGAVAITGANAANWTCSSNAAAPQSVTCTSSTVISNTAGSNTSVFNLTVGIAANAPATVTNTASISGGAEATANTANNSASDPTSTVAPAAPNITLLKSCPSPANCTTAPQLAGTNLTYLIQFTNTGGQSASGVTILDAVPLNTDFKVGSAAASAETSGLTFIIEYSNNFVASNPAAATWNYTPTSAGGGAAAGYDRNVKSIRWTFAGNLSRTAPNNTGNVSFTVVIR